MAIFWTTLFCTQYAENGDTVFIATKTFNIEPNDKYPVFSLCFKGTDFHWYNDLDIFKSYGMSTAQFKKMIKGQPASRYERNHSLQFYTKIPALLSDGPFENFDHFHIRSANFLKELQFFYDRSENNVHLYNDQFSNDTTERNIHLSYQTPDTICFTRSDKDALNSFRLYDLITLNGTILQERRYLNTKLEIFIHYPGLLIRSLDTPKYTRSFVDLVYDLRKKPGRINLGLRDVLEFRILQSKTLRKRADSNIPCIPNIGNYDEHLQKQVIRELGCVPVYWKYLLNHELPFDICVDPDKLREAFRNISDASNILKWNQQPCDEMSLLAMNSVNPNTVIQPNDIAISFHYKEKMYEEVQYSKAMEFESWLSNVGGFVGIFLGYSMMQFPELAVWIFHLFHERKYKILGGKLVTESIILQQPALHKHCKIYIIGQNYVPVLKSLIMI